MSCLLCQALDSADGTKSQMRQLRGAGAVRGATPHPRSGRWPRGATPHPRSGAAERSYPTFKVRSGGREELPLAQGQRPRLRVQAPEEPRSGQEELPHAGGQGWRRRGATPRSRSEGAAMRRYLSSKVRSSSCSLLEQP